MRLALSLILCLLGSSLGRTQAFFDVTMGAVVNSVVGGVQIEGGTNLPDGAIIMVTMGGGGSIFERTTVARKGYFLFPVLPAPQGHSYSAIVGLADFATQPAHIRRLIGEQGELLRGSTVERVAGTTIVSQMTVVQFRR